MLITNWTLAILVCVGPIILGLLSALVYEFFRLKDEVSTEVEITPETPREAARVNLRDETQWRRAYMFAAR